MVRACLGKRRGLGGIPCKQSGAGKDRIDTPDLRIEPADGGFRLCDPLAQRSELGALLRGRASDIHAPGAGGVAHRAALGGLAGGGAFCQHEFPIVIEVAVEFEEFQARFNELRRRFIANFQGLTEVEGSTEGGPLDDLATVAVWGVVGALGVIAVGYALQGAGAAGLFRR